MARRPGHARSPRARAPRGGPAAPREPPAGRRRAPPGRSLLRDELVAGIASNVAHLPPGVFDLSAEPICLVVVAACPNLDALPGEPVQLGRCRFLLRERAEPEELEPA